MKNKQLSQLDHNQIVKAMFDEENDAQRVRLVASDIANITEGLKEAIQGKLESIEIKYPELQQQSSPSIIYVDKPVVVKEIEYREVEKQVIVEKIVYKEIEKPYVVQTSEYKEIEKPIIVEKVVYKEINTSNQIQDNKFFKVILILQSVILLGLLIAVLK